MSYTKDLKFTRIALELKCPYKIYVNLFKVTSEVGVAHARWNVISVID